MSVKKKKTTKKKTAAQLKQVEQDLARFEAQLNKAKEKAFREGWEAAKLDSFATLAERKEGSSFWVCPSVSKFVLPLVKERMTALGASRMEARYHGWNVIASTMSKALEDYVLVK